MAHPRDIGHGPHNVADFFEYWDALEAHGTIKNFDLYDYPELISQNNIVHDGADVDDSDEDEDEDDVEVYHVQIPGPLEVSVEPV